MDTHETRMTEKTSLFIEGFGFHPEILRRLSRPPFAEKIWLRGYFESDWLLPIIERI
jgi:hypothetical protein